MSSPEATSLPGTGWRDDRALGICLGALGTVLFLGVVIRFGWMSDDAFISFRAAGHLVSGQGLVSNVGERVQGFTNPLWTLLVALPYRVSGDIYGSAMALSLLCCLGTAILVWRLHQGSWRVAWTLLLLACSSGFVSFSTGGLENALAHLLLTAFFFASTRPSPATPWLWLLGGLVVLNRMDHALLVLPTLALALARDRRDGRWRDGRADGRAWRWYLIGLAPLVAWMLFSLVYYGFPYPNTAYAKLNTPIPRGTLLAQGITYLVDSLLTDPLVLPVIALALVGTWWLKPHSRVGLAHASGVLLYLLYVCWIGGDFMSGRFLTAPFLVAVLLLSQGVDRQPLPALLVAAGALLVGQRLFAPMPSDLGTVCAVPLSGIVDERACYVEHTGLAQNIRTKKFRQHPYFIEGLKLKEDGKRVVVNNGPGLPGFAAGPGVHLIDPYALTDPLLARLELREVGGWRPGHVTRPVLAGYPESVEQGQNRIADPCARALLDDLWLITRGPLFSGARWRAIWQRNVITRTCPAP